MTAGRLCGKLAVLMPGILFIAAAIGLMEAAGYLGWGDPVLVPPPSKIAGYFAELVVSGAFLPPLRHTLYLLFVGYGLACLLGIATGALMGTLRPAFNLLEPLVELIRPLPKPALLPALILFMGLGDGLEIVMVLLAAFFPVLISTLQGVRTVDPVLIETARTFGYPLHGILVRVILPASAPMILAGMKVSLGIGLVLVILSEMFMGGGGVGGIIVDMQRSFRISEMYAWIVMLALLGYALTLFFNWFERRVAFWATRNAAAE